jgi:hypothetical protein
MTGWIEPAKPTVGRAPDATGWIEPAKPTVGRAPAAAGR